MISKIRQWLCSHVETHIVYMTDDESQIVGIQLLCNNCRWTSPGVRYRNN